MKIENLENLVSNNKVEEGLDIVIENLSSENELYNDFILLKANHARCKNLFYRNEIDINDFDTRIAKNNNAFLELLKEIEPENISRKTSTESPSKIKFLFLAANPKETSELELEKEYIGIRRILKDKRYSFEINEEFDVTLDSFFEEIKVMKPQLIQFSGHSTNKGLVFSGGMENKLEVHPWKYLISMFKLISDQVEFAFINAVESEKFVKELSLTVPFALGINGLVSNKAAIEFSSAFYSALTNKRDYHYAFKIANQIMDNNANSEPVKWIDFLGKERFDKVGEYCLYYKGKKQALTKNK